MGRGDEVEAPAGRYLTTPQRREKEVLGVAVLVTLGHWMGCVENEGVLTHIYASERERGATVCMCASSDRIRSSAATLIEDSCSSERRRWRLAVTTCYRSVGDARCSSVSSASWMKDGLEGRILQ